MEIGPKFGAPRLKPSLKIRNSTQEIMKTKSRMISSLIKSHQFILIKKILMMMQKIENWQAKFLIQLRFDSKDKITNDKIIPRVTGHGLKKCLDKKPMPVYKRSNTIAHSLSAPNIMTSEICCNVSFVELRDEGGLLWPTIYVARACGIVVEALNHSLSKENL